MKHYFSILFFLMFSCAEKSGEKNGYVKVNINLDDSQERNLSEKFEDIRYVLLNYSDSLPLVNPYIIRFSNDKIFVSDRVLDNILIFDNEGNYLNGILSTGDGPEEFIQIEDFQLINDFIFVQDNRLKKILKFTIEGDFVEERKNLIPSSNTYLTDKFELHFMNNFQFGEGFNFIRRDLDQSEVGYYPISNDLAGLKMALNNGFIFDNKRNEIILEIPNSNKVAFFNPDGFFSKELEFDLGNARLSDDLRSKLRKNEIPRSYLNEANICEGSSAFYPFEDEYFGFFQRGGKEFHYVFFDENFKTTFQTKKFKNDLDGMTINGIPWSYKNNELVFMINSIEFLNSFNNKEQEMEANFPDREIHSFTKMNLEKLRADKTVLAFLKVR